MASLFSFLKTPEIEFLCYPEDLGVIAEPQPAGKFMPDWFKRLPSKVDKLDKLRNSTIKRCAPFLDALTAGWIIPLAADVEFISNADASGVNYRWDFYRPMVENHTPEQVAGHPSLPRPPMKFLNYWTIKTPPGISLLFTPPLNRPDPRFTCFSGIVDTDHYREFINFPFFLHQPNFTGVVARGTPLVQVIPIRREKVKAQTRAMNDQDRAELEHFCRRARAGESLYRNELWVRK